MLKTFVLKWIILFIVILVLYQYIYVTSLSSKYVFFPPIKFDRNNFHFKRSKCYLLFKTHKLTKYILQRMIKAKNEVSNYDCSFTVLYWVPVGTKTLRRKNINELNTIMNNNISYFLIDDGLLKEYSPNVLNDFKNRKIKWLGGGFEWNFGAIPEILWYKYNEKYINDYDNIWMMEYDVGWKGNIGDILIKTFNLNKTLNKYGYLGTIISKIELHSEFWDHSSKLYGFDESKMGNIVSHTLLSLIRYKGYLLNSMYIQLYNSLYLYCEMQGASICNKEIYINNDFEYINNSCKCGSIVLLRPNIIVSDDYWSNLPGAIKSLSQWNNVLKNDFYPNNTLYHPIKF